ncbi:MAG: flagellar biosynthetic protein FliO, partial [Treponema sp.]|nr:flagellar biosynthetic protein FliO [Treponema sp.]
MILVLGIVLAIVLIIFKLMKRSTDPGNSTDEFLRKVSSLTISPGKSVQIVTLIDKAYLLGVSDNSVNLITEIEDPELIQAMNLYADKNGRVERPKSFEDVLELFMPKKKKKENN